VGGEEGKGEEGRNGGSYFRQWEGGWWARLLAP
jgi:hypothetical protein